MTPEGQEESMVVLADVSFGQVLLAVLEVFLFAAWLMVLFVIISDLFRDHQISGWGKAIWVVFLIFVPFLTALIYLIARGDGMRERAVAAQHEQQKQVDAYIRQAAGSSGSPADELTKLAKLHDDHKLSDEEFGRAKSKIVA
jgi:Phospholipase_D-nuclease N-terminal